MAQQTQQHMHLLIFIDLEKGWGVLLVVLPECGVQEHAKAEFPTTTTEAVKLKNAQKASKPKKEAKTSAVMCTAAKTAAEIVRSPSHALT